MRRTCAHAIHRSKLRLRVKPPAGGEAPPTRYYASSTESSSIHWDELSWTGVSATAWLWLGVLPRPAIHIYIHRIRFDPMLPIDALQAPTQAAEALRMIHDE